MSSIASQFAAVIRDAERRITEIAERLEREGRVVSGFRVGQRITADQVSALPNGTEFADCDGDVWVKEEEGFRFRTDHMPTSLDPADYEPLSVETLPEEEPEPKPEATPTPTLTFAKGDRVKINALSYWGADHIGKEGTVKNPDFSGDGQAVTVVPDDVFDSARIYQVTDLEPLTGEETPEPEPEPAVELGARVKVVKTAYEVVSYREGQEGTVTGFGALVGSGGFDGLPQVTFDDGGAVVASEWEVITPEKTDDVPEIGDRVKIVAVNLPGGFYPVDGKEGIVTHVTDWKGRTFLIVKVEGAGNLDGDWGVKEWEILTPDAPEKPAVGTRVRIEEVFSSHSAYRVGQEGEVVALNLGIDLSPEDVERIIPVQIYQECYGFRPTIFATRVTVIEDEQEEPEEPLADWERELLGMNTPNTETLKVTDRDGDEVGFYFREDNQNPVLISTANAGGRNRSTAYLTFSELDDVIKRLQDFRKAAQDRLGPFNS